MVKRSYRHRGGNPSYTNRCGCVVEHKSTPTTPPPPGELRKVKITYRCSICYAEARMTIAPAEDPEPPKHCGDAMDLVTPVDDA